MKKVKTKSFKPNTVSKVQKKKLGKNQLKKVTNKKKGKAVKEVDYYDIPVENDYEDEDNLSGLDHKKDLDKLKHTDPEFYKFLEENDKSLLEFNMDDSDSDNAEEEDKIHKPPDKLEVDSDEEDYEGDGKKKLQSGPEKLVTLKMVAKWQEDLLADTTVNTMTSVIKAFHAALQSVTKDSDDSGNLTSDYKVVGSSVFNAVVQLCVLELQPALVKFLKLPTDRSQLAKAQPAKAKHWIKIKTPLKEYFTDLFKLLSGVTSEHILCVMLKHLHQMSSFLAYYNQIIKQVLKRLVVLWSESDEETVRVLSFLCILRITTIQQNTWLDPVLKLMYSAYITNSKFVSPTTLPGINFMRRSLTEILALDPSVTYQHAFLYIRQLAIHLRNAITITKKENKQAVYNWQYMSSLRLWTDVLCVTHGKTQLQSLLYPLVQVIIGSIKLIPTARYFPLRFHCCQMLNNLSKDTGSYIPVLPFILEVLTLAKFDKGHQKVSMKPLDFTCILKLSKSQLSENAFKDAAIEQVYRLTLEFLATESHRICFPDLTLLPILNLKKFLKSSKINKYIQKLQGALKKIEENAEFIENERKKLTLNLNDKQAIEAWEQAIQAKGTPLNTFCNSLKKIYMQQEAKRATDNDKIGEYKLPVLKKGEKRRNREDEPVVKFPSSDDDSDEDESSLLRLDGEPRNKKVKKTKLKTEDDKKEDDKKRTTGKLKNHQKIGNSNEVNDDDDEYDDDLNDKEDEVVDINLSDFD